MNELAGTITAIAAVVAAGGGILAAVLTFLTNRATRGIAKDTTEARKLILDTQGDIHEVGERVDGRLSDLLKVSIAGARAEGVAAGEQAQRDRSAGPTNEH